jgi:DNA-binding transcriptional regulator/RsmH inhibitor MraZ
MGDTGLQLGAEGRAWVVRVFGFQESLKLDNRGRFRLPDDLVGALHRALASAQAGPSAAAAPAAAFERLSFYFVPGAGRRILLYPPSNITLAVERFEDPPPGMDPQDVRQARDYFYFRMRFVEADRQNRLLIPEGLREHAGIGPEVEEVSLVAHNYWLALSPSALVRQQVAQRLEAFGRMAPDLLDPAYRTPTVPRDVSPPDPVP